jgi:hypothetical protein
VYNFDIEKISDKIWVFKNAVKNSKEFIDYFEKSRTWRDWYTFGKVADGPEYDDLIFKNFPTPEEWEDAKAQGSQNSSERKYFENEISNLFYYATKRYVEDNNVILDNWVEDGWNIAKYAPSPENFDYAMMHHTDFQRDFAYTPDLKFAVTAVFYLNDDYDGGEICFRIIDEKDPLDVKQEYVYKPSEGDILIFPSGPPYFHGVKAITSGEKYIIRNYWRYQYPGHPLWLKLQEKYGEDIWRQLEEQRLKFNRTKENMTVINNIQFWVDFEEYYKKEIEMLNL